MKSRNILISSLILATIVLPFAPIRAQVSPTDPASSEQIDALKTELISLLTQLLTQLQQQLSEAVSQQASSQSQVNQSISNLSKKVDTIVSNTTPAPVLGGVPAVIPDAIAVTASFGAQVCSDHLATRGKISSTGTYLGDETYVDGFDLNVPLSVSGSWSKATIGYRSYSLQNNQPALAWPVQASATLTPSSGLLKLPDFPLDYPITGTVYDQYDRAIATISQDISVSKCQ